MEDTRTGRKPGQATPIEIAHRPNWNMYHVVGFVPAIVIFASLVAMVNGVLYAIILLGIACLSAVFAVVVSMWGGVTRMWIDDEGIALGPYRDAPFLRRRPKRFRIAWAEIKCVRNTRTFIGRNVRAVTIILDRRVVFWSLHRQPDDKITLSAELGRDPRFIEAVRAHVPPDRIEAGALRTSFPPFPYPRILGGAYAFLALIAGWITWQWSLGNFAPLVWWVALGLVCVILFVEVLSAGIERAEIAASHGPCHMVVSCSTLLVVCSYFAPIRAAFPALSGALAAMSLYLSALVLIPQRWPGWQRAALVYVAFGIGAVAGWFSYPAHYGMVLCEGETRGAVWTPDGSAFLVHVTPNVLTSTGVIQWFSRDGSPGAVAQVPRSFWALAVGKTGAVVRGAVDLGKDSDAAVWFVPINDKPQLLLSGGAVGAVGSYPSRRYALFWTWNETQTDLHFFDFATRQTRHCGVVPSKPPRRRVAFTDEGHIYWLEGERPMVAPQRPVSRSDPVPPDGKYFAPGKPFTIYWTGPDIDGPRHVLYADAATWIDWEHDPRPFCIRACRLSGASPPRLEFVRIDFSGAEAVVTAISQAEFTEASRPQGEQSHGDYDLVADESTRITRLVHRPTGRSRLIECGNTHLLPARPAWAPDGRRFVVSGMRLHVGVDTLQWTRPPEELTSLFHPIVYLVDCDAEFGSK